MTTQQALARVSEYEAQGYDGVSLSGSPVREAADGRGQADDGTCHDLWTPFGTPSDRHEAVAIVEETHR